MKYTLIILMIVTLSQTYQIMVYQALIPKLLWSNDTLWLNFKAQRGLYLGCKNKVQQPGGE